MSLDYVPTPAGLAGVALAELAQAYTGHVGALVDARHGIGRPHPPARLASIALDALAVGQAVADHVLRHRWLTVAEALTYGATLPQVATASALTTDEVTAGVRSWADAQHRHAGMSAATRDEILTLLTRATGGAR